MHTFEKGSLQRIVGEKFRVAKTTVADIWKDHDEFRLILALFDEHHFVRDYHVPCNTRCSLTNPIIQLASQDFAV